MNIFTRTRTRARIKPIIKTRSKSRSKSRSKTRSKSRSKSRSKIISKIRSLKFSKKDKLPKELEIYKECLEFTLNWAKNRHDVINVLFNKTHDENYNFNILKKPCEEKFLYDVKLSKKDNQDYLDFLKSFECKYSDQLKTIEKNFTDNMSNYYKNSIKKQINSNSGGKYIKKTKKQKTKKVKK
tara:strand:+ start:3561 stop:4109 length:549 start_codon:yes stop_codon:yes gene_type:complete